MNAIVVRDVEVIDEVARICDVRLAEALGFGQVRDIRKIIERNIEELLIHGPSRQRGAMVEIGSGAKREVQEYWLNEQQALLICMFSRTTKAAEVRAQMIDAFMAVQKRRNQVDPLTFIRALDGLREQINGMERRVVAANPGLILCHTWTDERYSKLTRPDLGQKVTESLIRNGGRESLPERSVRRGTLQNNMKHTFSCASEFNAVVHEMQGAGIVRHHKIGKKSVISLL